MQCLEKDVSLVIASQSHRSTGINFDHDIVRDSTSRINKTKNYKNQNPLLPDITYLFIMDDQFLSVISANQQHSVNSLCFV